MSQLSLTEFADKIHEIMPVIIREFARRQTDELYKGKVTLPQILILDFLDKKGESKMKDLAHFMGVSTAAMTGVVERLVKSGYAVRIFDPQDRRIIKIKTTSPGSKLVKKISQHRRQMIIRIFGKISESERQDYLKILMHIYEILTKKQEESL